MKAIPVPETAVRIALVGAGQRAWRIYRPILQSLAHWAKVVAVCDPVLDHREAMAGVFGVPAYSNLRTLVDERPMEAALIVTPIDSHYAVSTYLLSHEIHCLVETPWCNTVEQARQMIDTARRHNVLVRVAENFFRMPIDRIVQKIAKCNGVGTMHRVVSYGDHTGYHNNSRWIVLTGQHPLGVQSLEHSMPTISFYSTPQREHKSENYRARFYYFPNNFLVMDHAANIKGFLGRIGRPGYTEWQGERGTVIHRSIAPWEGLAEVRYLTDEGRKHVDPDVDHTHPLETFPIIHEYEKSSWLRSFVELPDGKVEHVNHFRPACPAEHRHTFHGCTVMDHITDFALAVRNLAKSEFDEEDALMSLMMEIGATESAKCSGKYISLPLNSETESEQAIIARLRDRYGLDPLDGEGMLDLSFPKI
jgi:predicted dehydrogenase